MKEPGRAQKKFQLSTLKIRFQILIWEADEVARSFVRMSDAAAEMVKSFGILLRECEKQ